MTAQPARLVNTEQENNTHSRVRVDAASSVMYVIKVTSRISHIAVTSITSSTRGQWRTQCSGQFWSGELRQLMWFWKGSPSRRCSSENPLQLLTASASNTADLKQNASVRPMYRMFHIYLLFKNNGTFLINEKDKACVCTLGLWFILPLKNKITFFFTFW